MTSLPLSAWSRKPAADRADVIDDLTGQAAALRYLAGRKNRPDGVLARLRRKARAVEAAARVLRAVGTGKKERRK
jgi:hypothetical protein